MANAELEQRCNTLRHDLKIWEKKFAALHDGRKAGRADIKADADISTMYKEYNKLRDVLSGNAAPQTPSKRASTRKAPRDVEGTPEAPKVLASTPLKRKREQQEPATQVIASPSQLLSSQGPSFIGPTPQRDGIVLGLFDMLPAETPSKKRAVLNPVAPNILQTPSKHTGKAGSETSIETRARGDKTPLSAGRRFLLDQFVTPRKMKLEEQGTPTSTLKGFTTPAFLRRDNFLGPINEENEPTPRPAPWKRRGLGRSLSAMIQSMKKQEDDRLDEEADIMRELELEAEGVPPAKKPKLPEILVEDSQSAMPLGPDRGLESDDEEIEEAKDELGPDGKPKKVWKKKGLKRQTRRVIMRPNFSRPKAPLPQLPDDESGEEGSKVAETQPAATAQDTSKSGDEFSYDNDSEYASDNSHTPKTRRIPKKKAADSSASKAEKSKQGKEGPVQAAARKIKATAHANYRRLKIKSKGGNGGKGRFGRRR